MSESSSRGIPQSGLGEAFLAEEARKSRLILEGRLLRQRQQPEAAAAKFAEAAAIEEQLGETCADQQLREKSFVHCFSAASCWAQAGNFYEAISLCDQLLAADDLPDPLRAGSSTTRTHSAIAAPNGTGNSSISWRRARNSKVDDQATRPKKSHDQGQARGRFRKLGVAAAESHEREPPPAVSVPIEFARP